MEIATKPQYLLILPGVSLSNYKPVEDIFDDKIMDRFDVPVISTVYDKVPNSFSGLKSWPKQTNLKCLNCDRKFLEIPKFYAKDLARDTTGNIEMAPIKGYMCSFVCVRSYIDTFIHKKEDKWNALDRLNLMYQIFTGEEAKDILPAPSKCEREEYGGLWDMDKYISELKKIDAYIDLNSKILERANKCVTLDQMVTNCTLTGQLKNETLVETITDNDSKWEKAEQCKFDSGIIYD